MSDASEVQIKQGFAEDAKARFTANELVIPKSLQANIDGFFKVDEQPPPKVATKRKGNASLPPSKKVKQEEHS